MGHENGGWMNDDQRGEYRVRAIICEALGVRRPLEFEGRFLWHPVPPGGHLDDQFDYLPPSVFALLTGHIPRENPRVDAVAKAYPTRELAWDALARATAHPYCPACQSPCFVLAGTCRGCASLVEWRGPNNHGG